VEYLSRKEKNGDIGEKRRVGRKGIHSKAFFSLLYFQVVFALLVITILPTNDRKGVLK
jgi:hypothetical protein